VAGVAVAVGGEAGAGPEAGRGHGADAVTAPAGYSGKPLAAKLGIRADTRVLTVNAPANYRSLLGDVPACVEFVTRAKPPVGFAHVFTTSAADLAARLPKLLADLAPDGVIWVSWPKKASGVDTDLTEDRVRAAALPLGLVDVKVCAVDAVWSGLKVVIRREKRKGT
jgi:hypothetical protein